MSFVTSVMIFLTLLNIIVHYLRQHHDQEEEEEEEYGERNDASFLLSDGLCRRFSLAEIKSATQNFNEGLVVGEGGFGKVYRGIIDKGASTVAIKRLGLWSKQGATEFRTEIEMLSKFRHSHLASLIGYCSDHPEMIIVYEYMPNGTLNDNLHKVGRTNRPRLSWVQRLKICLGAARGLDYLHTGTSIRTRVIHRDVKSSNILLDANWEAKISDFGLSKIGPAEQTCTHVSTHVKGTFGYLDPEYFLTHRLTRKSDVFAFGVVMFEALCGRPAVDVRLDEEQWGLAKWAKHCIKERRLHEIVDPHLRGSILSNCLESFAQIAEQCLHKSSRKRPTMAEVVTRLEYAMAMQETTDLSLMDADIISIGGDYDNPEGADSSTEAEVNDAGGGNLSTEREVVDTGNVGHNGEHAASRSQYHIQPAKIVTFVKQVRLYFSTRPPVFSAEEYSDFCLQQLKRFSFHELQVATDNFSKKNILGRGGFGKVYKGCLVDGSLVAVKRLIEKHSQAGELQFQKEVEVIGLALHRNLLQLRGFCSTPTERLLVYPYMGNGSVASCLGERSEGQSALDWRTRKRIALGSARGLACLHVDYIVHGNVKAASIFLTEFSDVVLGNFGLAQLMYQNVAHLPALVRGPSVYLAPEYLSTGKCSLKTDVFGYGVMLLELICGHGWFGLPWGADYTHHLVMMLDWVKELVMERKLRQLVDVDLLANYAENDVERLTKVALLCTQSSSMKRPRMSEVVRMLQGDDFTERWEEWQEEIFHQEFGKTCHSHTGWNPNYL